MKEKIYNVNEAKTHFSRLIRESLAGERVLIGRRNDPLVSLTVYRPSRRKLGLYEGQGWIAEDFDAPLEDFEEYK